jgi:hypothetical protein
MDVENPLDQDLMLSMVDMAMNIGYTATAAKVKYLHFMLQAAFGFAKMRSIVVANGGFAKFRVNVEAATALTSLRRTMLHWCSVVDVDAAIPADEFLDGACVLQASWLKEEICTMIDSSRTAWESDLGKLSTMLEGYMPTGFEVVLPSIFEGNDDMIDAIVLNADSARLHKGNEMLARYTVCCRDLNAAGLGPFIAIDVIKVAMTVSRSAASCLITAYALLAMLDKIPQHVSPAIRKREARNLKIEMKPHKLHPVLTARLNALLEGETPGDKVYDFEGKQKARDDAAKASVAAAVAAAVAPKPEPIEDVTAIADGSTGSSASVAAVVAAAVAPKPKPIEDVTAIADGSTGSSASAAPALATPNADVEVIGDEDVVETSPTVAAIVPIALENAAIAIDVVETSPTVAAVALENAVIE